MGIFLLLCSHQVVSNSLRPYGPEPARLLCPWDFPGKNTAVGRYFFLQGIFPTQRSNLCLLHWQADSLPLSYQGSPDILFPPKIMLNCSWAVGASGKQRMEIAPDIVASGVSLVSQQTFLRTGTIWKPSVWSSSMRFYILKFPFLHIKSLALSKCSLFGLVSVF